MDHPWFMLEAAARRSPDRIAVVDGDVRRTWLEVRQRALGLAARLRGSGVSDGDRVAVLLPNGAPFLELTFAAAAQGAVLTPLNLRLSPREIADILCDAHVRVLVVDGSLEELARAALRQGAPVEEILIDPEPGDAFTFEPVPADLDELGQLYYTSGTTGRPKGVMLTWRNLAAHAEAVIDELELTAADVWGHIAPMFHLADAWATIAVTMAGGRHVMLPRFDAEEALALLADEGVTLSNLVPTMLNFMTAHPRASEASFPALRTIMSGGAPIAPELVRRIIEVFGCRYVQTYGMTETCPYLLLGLLPQELSALPDEERLKWLAMTGRPFKAVELEVVAEDGRTVPEDGRSVGEIRVRGATVTPGYWRQPEVTSQAFADGWLMTGDLAVRHPHGFVDIVDRKKDVIITGGENVYSTEVEGVLYEHAAILEAAVFGTPDATWGEVVTAALVQHQGARITEEEVIVHCRTRLAAFKVPRLVRFMDELPKTGSGKIAKRALREGS